MAPKGKDQPKGKSFRWNLEATKILLNICLDYQKANGVDQPFSWVKISEELEQKIGKECCCVSVKNKFDHMKRLWHLWKKLWQTETCIAWNPVKGSIEADDAWWGRKIKENEKYKQFRKKGLPFEIDELCKHIFRTKHGGEPSRDPLEAEADGSETETEAQSQSQSQSKVDAGETEAQSQSKTDAGETEAQSQSKANGGNTEAQINQMLQLADRIPLYYDTWRYIFSSSSICKPGSYNFVDNSIVDHYPKVDESETQAPTQSNTVQSQSEADGGETETQKHRMLQQDIRATKFHDFLAKSINLEPEVDGGPTRSNTVQSQSEADGGETEAQKHRMLQQDLSTPEFRKFLAQSIINSVPEVDGGPTRSNMVQSQSEADGGETEALKHRRLQQDICTPGFREFLAQSIINSEPKVDGGPTLSNMVQSQSEADGGKTEAQSQSKVGGIETDAQSQPEAQFQNQLLPTCSKFKKSNGGRPSSPVLAKRKRNQSTGAALYNSNTALIDGANLKMVSSLSAGDVGMLEAVAPKEKYTYVDAMFVIERLVKEGSLVADSKLWCFGVDEMLKDDARLAFLNIYRDSGRLAWLKWRFELAHPKMHNK